ncbi:transcription termination factor MTEF18, mitochondrial-like [Euphorbia lathyris]|uniref:transcription termination factor MTEF18, mitochondrial-like n=1 Tax=Euphorbia lathyris TaxID=212925 RepID=UPI0033142EB4
MIRLHILRTPAILKWASINFFDSYKIPVWPSGSLFCIANNPRFYRRKEVVDNDMDGEITPQIGEATIKRAQAALIDYLHSTRTLELADAEHMSKNSPVFLAKLLEKVGCTTLSDTGRSVTRFLRYHPINEFEPFFESSGLRPHQYESLLPRDLMFLTDDDLLLVNYSVLCSYGIPRNKVGKIYKEAREVFQYNYGVLASKLKAYEEVGLEQSFIGKMVICSPNLLTGNVNVYFIKSVEILRKGGKECCWIEQHLSDKISYNWSRLYAILELFSNAGYSEEDLGRLMGRHPGILFESSGENTLSLIGFLFKFGSSINQMHYMFLEFPEMTVGKFLSNLKQCFLLFNEIEMETEDIGKIICSHSLVLGSCSLKKTNSLLSALNVGKKRLCDIILQNPEEMRNWVMGSKVKPMPSTGERLTSQMLKTNFLVDLGFVEKSKEMEKALKVFRGKGDELQERFDCIMQAGLDRKDVIQMIKIAPQVLNQRKEVIQMKIDYFLNDLGYPVSSLVSFPAFLTYTIPTIKLRLTMYNWLKDHGKVGSTLSLSSLIGCSDKLFVKRYVELHPRGPEVWQDLKKNIVTK